MLKYERDIDDLENVEYRLSRAKIPCKLPRAEQKVLYSLDYRGLSRRYRIDFQGLRYSTYKLPRAERKVQYGLPRVLYCKINYQVLSRRYSIHYQGLS